MALTFPHCNLYSINIVRSLPRNCPLASEKATDVIQKMQDDALAEMGKADGNPIAHYQLAEAETCFACLKKNARHPVIVHLRRAR